jgi:hypothetical protein
MLERVMLERVMMDLVKNNLQGRDIFRNVVFLRTKVLFCPYPKEGNLAVISKIHSSVIQF